MSYPTSEPKPGGEGVYTFTDGTVRPCKVVSVYGQPGALKVSVCVFLDPLTDAAKATLSGSATVSFGNVELSDKPAASCWSPR